MKGFTRKFRVFVLVGSLCLLFLVYLMSLTNYSRESIFLSSFNLTTVSSGIPNTFDSKPYRENATAEVEQNFVQIDRGLFEHLISRLEGSKYPGVDIFTQYFMAISGRKPLLEQKPLRPEFGQVINDVTFYQYPIQIEPCKKNDRKNRVLVIVNSAPGNFQKRTAIRETWLRHLRSDPKDRYSDVSINLVSFAFIIGRTKDDAVQKKIEEESKEYKDILQIGMIDEYYNLTTKVAGLLQWIHKNCSPVDFLLKTDDDVYVNVNHLAASLQTANQSDKVLFGLRAPGVALRSTKWSISVHDWPWWNYPPYPTGNAVLVMGSTLESLLAAAQTIPYLPFDDTYFWGLCNEKIGIVNKMDSGRFYRGGMDPIPPPCEVFMTVSWGVSSPEHSNKSHEAIENLYSNKTQCVMTWPSNTNRAINPSLETYPVLY